MMSIMKTIERAIRPLFLTCQLLGLCVYTTKPYLITLYNVIVWCIYSYLFYYIAVTIKKKEWFQATFTIIYYGMNFLVSITFIIISLYQHKRLRKFIKRLAAIDDTLKELGTPKMYKKLHIRIKRILILWLVCSQMANIYDMPFYCHTTEDKWCMLLPYIMNHIQHANLFVSLVFSTCLWYISTRFDKLNEHMRCLLLNDEHSIRNTWKKMIVPAHQYIMYINNYKRVLWITMHLHLELCQLTRELNAIFETHITMDMISHLIHFIGIFRYIYIHLTANDDYISPIISIDLYIWLFLQVCIVCCINYMCESVSAKSNEMNLTIHRLTDALRYADIRNEIYQFTLQIMHHPLKLSGLGLFDFGNGFLRKYFMTVLTFLIIVIQMPGTSKTFAY